MQTQFLIEQGNQHRENREYAQALQCYAMAFVQDPDSAAAFNNYGNVMREIGHPRRAIPFLQHARELDPGNVTTQFNLAVSYLLMGDYQQGWPAYESRWNYEHLAGTEPQFQQPRWRGGDLQGRTVLIVGEQGHGDNIQFVRFAYNLHVMGARLKLQVTAGLVPLLSNRSVFEWVGTYDQDPGEFDCWVPIMSIPGVLGMTLENLPKPVQYLNADPGLVQAWQQRLGAKTRLRIGFSWSGRRDAWLNRHKGMPLDMMLQLIQQCPDYEWTNLQIDATAEESQALAAAGARLYPGAITGFHDTAALVHHQDVVISVDTAVAHLSAALGRPTWIMLQRFGVDWRWLLDRDSSPWYSTARLFRQPEFDDWPSVTDRVRQYLSWFKV
jgi:tetratricopeptide (TPR) repeat protein